MKDHLHPPEGASVVRASEEASVLPSPELSILLSALRQRQVYVVAMRTVLVMIVQSLAAGVIAYGVNRLFAAGFFWTGKASTIQTNTEFLIATMSYIHFCFVIVMLAGYSSALTQYKCIKQPTLKSALLYWLVRLSRDSFVHYVVSLGGVVTIVWVCASFRPTWQRHNIHFYCGSLFTHYYTSAVATITRRIFLTETVEGIAKGSSRLAPLWKDLIHSYITRIGYVVVMFVAAGYIHITSMIHTFTELNLICFGFASMALRFAAMRTMRRHILKLKGVHTRILYVTVALPTVMTNTQIRIALLRARTHISITGVVMLTMTEPILRLLKVWNVGREVRREDPVWVVLWNKLFASAVGRPQVRPSPPPRVAGGPVQVQVMSVSCRSVSPTCEPMDHLASKTTSLVSANLSREQRLLQFTAAEIHADMCSEYISIMCSLCVYFCLNGHPKYAWSTAEEDEWRLLAFQAIQLLAEIVIDVVCCVWELVNGIPLRTTGMMTRFLTQLFIGCAVANIALCCTFYLRSPPSGAE